MKTPANAIRWGERTSDFTVDHAETKMPEN